MAPDCNPDLHLRESVLPVLVRSVVSWVVIFFALLLLCIALGSLAFSKSLYRYWTITSAEIIVKVALIPGVNVKVVKKGSVEIPGQGEPRSGDEYVCFNVQDQLFLVQYRLAPVTFALGGLFAFAYIGVFLTEQWKLTSNCNSLDPLVMGESICFNYPCPNSIDCNAWNEAGKRETLLCWSLSIDVFGALIKFMGLVGSQVAIMHFLGLFTHRGCLCGGKKVWKQYLMIMAIYLTFVGILLVILVVLIVVGLNSDNLGGILVNFILPFAHLFMVAVVEVLTLVAFVYMLHRGPLVKPVEPVEPREEIELDTLPHRRVTLMNLN